MFMYEFYIDGPAPPAARWIRSDSDELLVSVSNGGSAFKFKSTKIGNQLIAFALIFLFNFISNDQ